VRLQEITSANRTQVESLRVLAEQEDFVAGVGRSLADAAAAPGSNPWYRAVYAGDVPVGFVMIGDDVPAQDDVSRWPYYLWRMLIDGRYQGRGYGSAALDLLTRYLRTRPGADELVTSVVPGEGSPLGFYVRYGFTPTDEWFDHEQVLRLPLRDRPQAIDDSTRGRPDLVWCDARSELWAPALPRPRGDHTNGRRGGRRDERPAR